MIETIINALVQTIERLLRSIFKYQIPFEKYLFQNYFVLNFILPFTYLSIETPKQISLD